MAFILRLFSGNAREMLLAGLVAVICLSAYAWHRQAVRSAIAWTELKRDTEWRQKLTEAEDAARAKVAADLEAQYAAGIEAEKKRAEAADAARIEAENEAASLASESETARRCLADGAIVSRLNRLRD